MSLLIDQKLPSLGADANLSTVSGMSSGGFMTVQMHIIYSALFVGAGIFAGGPYNCTHGQTTLDNCTFSPQFLNLTYLDQVVNSNFLSTLYPIDDPKNLKDAPVFIYSGILDTVVMPGVIDVTNEVYNRLGANVQYVNRFISQHVFPTDLPYNSWDCTKADSPYIGQCNFDGAGHMLKKILPQQDTNSIKERAMNWEDYGKLIEFDQTEFTTSFTLSQLSLTGYVYIPNNCNTAVSGGAVGCKLHVAFHGCSQSNKFLNETYVRHTGYLEWAATNDLIVLFPQNQGDADQTTVVNKNGCWDFYAYTGEHYIDKTGLQPSAIKSMIDRLMAQPTTDSNFHDPQFSENDDL